MWLYTIYGMYSATRSEKDPALMKVRARNDVHLANLVKKFPGELEPYSEIHTGIGTDYRARLFVPHSVWVSIVTKLVEDVDYSNFKREAEITVDPVKDYHYTDLLHDVWSESYSYQMKAQ